MPKILPRSGFLVIAVFLLAGCSGLSWFDKPQFPPKDLESFDERVTITERWSHGYSSASDPRLSQLLPVVDKGTVFAAGFGGEILAIDLESGDLVWEVEHSREIVSGVAVDQELVIVGDAQGYVVAIDRQDGRIRWEKSLTSELLARPVVSALGVVVKASDGRVFGLDPETGKEQWIVSTPMPNLTLRGSGSLVLFDDTVLVPLDNGRLMALDVTTGAEKWNVNVGRSSGRSEVARLSDLDSMPVIDGGIVYTAAYQGDLVALDALTGRVLWRVPFSSVSGVAVNSDSVYGVNAQSELWAYRASDGLAIWKTDALLNRRLSQPVMLGERLVVGDYDGYVHILAASSGELLGRSRVCSESVFSFQVVGSALLYACTEGDFGMLRLNDKL